MKDRYNILLRSARFQMGFKTYFTFCSCNEGIYNCCLASCCFFLFFFRLYCCTKTDQRRLIFLSPKMTGMQSRPSGNKSTSPQIKKKKTKCVLPSMACTFSLVETSQPNSMGVTTLLLFLFWCISLTVVWNIRSYYYFYVMLFNFVLV